MPRQFHVGQAARVGERLAGKWLADARFHATNEAVPDDLIAQLDAVYTDMALHRSGVRGFGAAQVFSNHPAVPVTTG
jgi:hypothetical protein